MLNYWNNIYSHFDPIAFHLGSIAVHWYGIMYALALIIAIYTAHWIIKKDNMDLSKDSLDSYIIWAEIGVILGARLGYILFYDTHTYYYLTHPWQIFNPFIDGMYAGISGMSYHGALIGFIIATVIWCRRNKISFWFMTDIAVLAIPVGYIFGRIGNFFNQELIGRVTDVPWGIVVNGTLRHPSQIYEALLEGLLVFIVLYYFRNRKKFHGQLALMYVGLYSLARITAEFFREPDIQLGFLYGTSWLTMGILISAIFVIISVVIYFVIDKKVIKKD
jgi:phosphatidylglycerol:prolipoprotein diacylglycerol transferase